MEKAICRICGRRITKNVGVMRMHYTMVHGRGVAGAAPTERQDMQYAGGIMARGYESMPAYVDGGEKQPSFHKMKVTGPRCAELITEPFQAMRELNPTLNAMIQSTEQMNKVVCDAAEQPLMKRRKFASSAVAMHDAHLQRLKALMSDSYHTYNPMAQAFAQQPPIPDEVPAVQPPPGEEEDESSLGSRAAMQRVMEAIPKQYRAKAATLGNYLKAHPNLIRVTPSGRPIVAGKEIEHAHITDVMRSLYLWPRSQALPRGVKEVLQALHSIDAPSYLLSNSAVREAYQSLPDIAGQSRMETEEQGQVGEQWEQEHEGEKWEQEPEGEEEEQEMSTPSGTPLPSAMPPLPPRKVEERVRTKLSPSMIPKLERTAEERAPGKPSALLMPKPEHSGSVMMQTRHAASKASSSSGIPTMSTKHELTKASSSQTGKGRGGITEHWYDDVRFPGKPIRVLRLYSTSTPKKSMKRKSNKATSSSQMGKDFGVPSEHMYSDPRQPGKLIRVLRLY